LISFTQKLTARAKVIRQVVRETLGVAAYEKRMIDIFKAGVGNVEKRVYRLAKKRVSSSFLPTG